jgi:HK97 family phage major capsid protein
MTALANLTTADLEKILRDTLVKMEAERAVDNMRASQEHGEKILKDHGLDALIRAAMRAGSELRADVDLQTGVVRSDPLKGRGLNFARWFRIQSIAAIEKRDATAVAQELAAKFPEYEPLVEKTRALTSTVFTGGGALVPPELAAEIIELLYARTVALQMGVRTLEFRNSLAIGKLNSGATVAYVGEAQNIVPNQLATGELRLTGKKASAITAISNELLRNPSTGHDTIVRDDLMQALALRRDLSVLRGTGDTFQPKGLANWINATNVFAAAGTTTANKVSDSVKAVRLVDESNIPLDSAGWVMSPRSKWSLFATLDANSNFVFAAQLAAGMLLGFPLRTTTQIPNNLGAGSDSEVYFGAWNDGILGFDQATPMAIEVFPNGTYFDGSALVSGISSDQTPVRILEGHDFVLRHDTTFSKVTGVQWT